MDNQSLDNTPSTSLQVYLQNMGIFPLSNLEEEENTLDMRDKYIEKDYFNDPRDEHGEVPY